jgi:hypothetical protein
VPVRSLYSNVPGEGVEPSSPEAETSFLNCQGWPERAKCSHRWTPEMDTKWTDLGPSYGHEARRKPNLLASPLT